MHYEIQRTLKLFIPRKKYTTTTTHTNECLTLKDFIYMTKPDLQKNNTIFQIPSWKLIFYLISTLQMYNLFTYLPNIFLLFIEIFY